MTSFKLFKERKISFFLIASSILLSVIGFILYTLTMKAMDGARLSSLLISATFVGILLLLASLIWDYLDLFKTLGTVCTFIGLGLFISSQLGNLGYYFAGIRDIGYGILPTFVVGSIFYFVSILASSVALFLKK